MNFIKEMENKSVVHWNLFADEFMCYFLDGSDKPIHKHRYYSPHFMTMVGTGISITKGCGYKVQ